MKFFVEKLVLHDHQCDSPINIVSTNEIFSFVEVPDTLKRTDNHIPIPL